MSHTPTYRQTQTDCNACIINFKIDKYFSINLSASKPSCPNLGKNVQRGERHVPRLALLFVLLLLLPVLLLLLPFAVSRPMERVNCSSLNLS